VSGKPFQSKLEPFFDAILEARRKRKTWRAIAQQLMAQGIVTTPQGVHAFVKRRLKRRYALGVAPEPLLPATVPCHSEKPLPEFTKLTDSPPPASEFTADPLTKPLRVEKPKSRWTVLKPNT
jgi:hypothetical protein